MLKVARVSSVIAVSTALICSVALPATAADTTGTFVTVTVTGEKGLAITAPTNASFGKADLGVAVKTEAQMGEVKVTDTRGATATTWTATVTIGDFVSTTKSFFGQVEYKPGDVTTTAGTLIGLAPNTLVVTRSEGFYVQKSDDPALAVPAVAAVGILGNNSAAWTPTLTLTVPDDVPSGEYKATLTHSVS